MGSDAGGSVRIPASYCSVVALKPSHSRLSFSPCTNHASTCAVKGPIAADLHSLAAVYAVVSQPPPISPFCKSPLASHTILHHAERPKVIGLPEAWLQDAAPGVQKLCRAVIERLAASKNYKVIPIEIPFVKEGRIAHAMTMLTDANRPSPNQRDLARYPCYARAGAHHARKRFSARAETATCAHETSCMALGNVSRDGDRDTYIWVRRLANWLSCGAQTWYQRWKSYGGVDGVYLDGELLRGTEY